MDPREPEAAEHERRAAPWAVLCLTAFGLGLVPAAPGTVASLAVAAALLWLPGSATAFVGLALFLLIFGCWATLALAGGLGSAGRKHGDPGWVVSDEVAGQAIATLGVLPAIHDWRLALLAFVLFRLFDIAKPGPVGAAERRPVAWGVLLDDLVAGA
ncbi:MAG: phosphatidylglycerophosphatase A, partial [Planctomycetota bacterium]|nr:phosphatidylglycerophosphatase A [Planctomycetota bacterium]